MQKTITRMLAHDERDQPAISEAFFSIDAIKRANREAGQFFFSPDTMRFFRSRVLPDVYGGRVFITSEQRGFDASDGRGYTVREIMPDGSIDEITGFNSHDSLSQARRAARAAINLKHAYYFEGQHGKGGRKMTYVVTDAIDPWHAMDRLHSNFRIRNCGRARDYMLPGGEHADHYPKLEAR